MLTWRAALTNFRDPTIAFTKIVTKAILGIFAGLLYFQVFNRVLV
jgi:hypothetical protein